MNPRTPVLPLVLALLLPAAVAAAPVAAQGGKVKTRPAAPAPAPAVPDWQKRIQSALSTPAFQHASVGVLVRSLDSGRVLYQLNPDLTLMPASNQKILTAALALAKLGPDHRFATTIWHTGKIDGDGTLNGDLYLVGSGDPSLDSQRLLDMAQQLKVKGVRKINGRIVGDGSAFDARVLGEGWQWDDEPFYYQAQVSGLNCDENVVLMTVAPGEKVGDPAEVKPGGDRQMSLGFEKSDYVRVTNRVTTVAAGPDVKPRLSFLRSRGRNEVTVSGTIPAAALPVSEAITIEDPALFAADRLADVCTVAGIKLPLTDKLRVESGPVPPDAVELVRSESAPVSSLVQRFLKVSDNLYGETLLKAVGKKVKGEGTTDAGAAALRDWLKECGIDASGLYVADGSGLSRMNNVTPRILCDVLTHIDRKLPAGLRDAFRNALPEGGVDGTLRNRFKDSFAQGRVRAKTGTLSGASSLSGYVITKAGERIVFSILMNNYDRQRGGSTGARAAQDAVVLALCDAPAAGSGVGKVTGF